MGILSWTIDVWIQTEVDGALRLYWLFFFFLNNTQTHRVHSNWAYMRRCQAFDIDVVCYVRNEHVNRPTDQPNPGPMKKLSWCVRLAFLLLYYLTSKTYGCHTIAIIITHGHGRCCPIERTVKWQNLYCGFLFFYWCRTVRWFGTL